MTIHELYQKSGELHGHYCPGLAIGVRAAAEAVRILGVENIHSHALYCITESRACYMDGIQMVFGCTLGNGNLEVRPRGKTAFNFYDRDTGRSVRLIAQDWPENMSREETSEFILTAPLEQVFAQTPVHFEAPASSFVRRPSKKCACCGESCSEPFLRVKDGKLVCLDCAEA